MAWRNDNGPGGGGAVCLAWRHPVPMAGPGSPGTARRIRNLAAEKSLRCNCCSLRADGAGPRWRRRVPELLVTLGVTSVNMRPRQQGRREGGRVMRIIIGITGASGIVLAVNLLRALARVSSCETHLVMSEGARRALKYESELSAEDVAGLATHSYAIDNLAARISSGSFRTDGMVIIPCSMKTLSGVVSGYTDNLLLRSADVCLKEKRRVILVTREMPLSSIHLRNLAQAANDGCTIIPPMMTFYNRPSTIQDMIDHVVGKVMMMFDLDFDGFKPWGGADDETAVM
jgi:flavin prenyltransferase